MRTILRVKLAVLQLAETLKEVTPRLIRVLLIIGLISGMDWLHSSTILAAPSLQAQPIIVRSGNGVRGSQDTLVRVLSYGRTGDISPTPADFVNAQTAPFAYIVPPYSSYIARLPNDPSAQWLAVNPQMAPHTALYAVPFEVTDSVITAASLDFFFSVDNAVNGVYINGSRISGNSYDGDYHAEYRFVRNDIAPLLQPNTTNWLYINASDYGAIAALIFSTKIAITGGGVQGISPNHGGNTGTVTVQINGSGFQADTQVKLTGLGTDINSISTSVLSTDTVIATFNLTDAQPGVRNVEVTNPDSTSIVLTEAFIVMEGGVDRLVLNLIGPENVRRGRQATFYGVATNDGNIDTDAIIIEFATQQLADESIYTNGLFANQAADQLAYALEFVYKLPPGKSINIPLDITFLDSNCRSLSLNSFNVDDLSDCEQIREYIRAAEKTLQEKEEELADIENAIKERCKGILDDDRKKECMGYWKRQGELVRIINNLKELLAKLRRREQEVCQTKTGEQALINTPSITQVTATQQMLPPQLICPVNSWDPNEKVGPGGANNERYLQEKLLLPYTIYFENQSSATAPAAEVVITDQLDTDLDWSTFSLSTIRFGNTVVQAPPDTQNYHTFVDLRPEKDLLVEVESEIIAGLLTVRLTSIDSATGLPPADALAGFLTPNRTAPEGEGSISYTIEPKPDRSTGTEIRNQAQIIFDVNPPINTGVWLNTIDKDKPSSAVLTLAAEQSTANFVVQWSGNDVGAGIQDYTIYVSENGAPFTVWLANTVETAATFTGQEEHTYTFYSVARDHTNNVEAAPTVADASTMIGILNKPPLCSTARPSIGTLWPANHKFAPIQVVGVTDPDNDPVTLVIDSIFQDEPVDAPGSGNTSPDGRGLGTSTTEVRAERAGSGNGRVYHISFTAQDGHGGTCSGKVTVDVPKSRGAKGDPVDDGPRYDSTISSVRASDDSGDEGEVNEVFLPLINR